MFFSNNKQKIFQNNIAIVSKATIIGAWKEPQKGRVEYGKRRNA